MRIKLNTRFIVSIGMLSAISFGLSFFEFTPRYSPSFMKLDISDMPALLASFSFGPISGVAVVFIKNLISSFLSNTGGIGELANFIIGASMVFASGLYYKRNRNLKGALLAMIIGSCVIAVVGSVVNYFILLPLYSKLFMPMDIILSMFRELMPFIKTKLDIIIYNSIPFNLTKGLIVSLFTFLLYKRIRPFLKENNQTK